jgi:hypothetical protein
MVSPGFVQVPFILWTLALPFDNTVWLVVMSVVVANALVFYAVERISLYLKRTNQTTSFDPSDPSHPPVADQPPLPLYMAFYVSLIQYTGQECHTQARAPAARLLSLGYHFFLFVVLSAYLANQAAVLVAPKQVATKALSLEGTTLRVFTLYHALPCPYSLPILSQLLIPYLFALFLHLVASYSLPYRPSSFHPHPTHPTTHSPTHPTPRPPDALSRSIPICALTGPVAWCQDCEPGSGSAYAIVRAAHPALRLVEVASNDPVRLVDAVQRGACGGAVMTVTEWEFVKNYREEGGDFCHTLQVAGANIRTLVGSHVGLMDLGPEFSNPR